jgi:hypothetical protein
LDARIPCGAQRPVCNQRCNSTIASHESPFISRIWVRSSDEKYDNCGRGQDSADEQIPRTTDSLQQLLRIQQLLTAIRTLSEMIFHAIALGIGESAIEIRRNFGIRQVTVRFV